MCGYLFVSSRTEALRPIDESIMYHRGPDHSKEIDLGWCRFRHWRLSIQDLTSGSNQPYSDGMDYLIYNGELYEYQNLGLRIFSTYFSSDTQFLFNVLKAGEFHSITGESGFYSFVFIKDYLKRIFSTRDPFGKKPLYYYLDSDLLVLASEERAVREIAREYGKTIPINAPSIAHYLRYKDLHFGSTFYDGVLEVPPGSTLEFDFEAWTLSLSYSWEDYYYSKPFYKSDTKNGPIVGFTLQQLKKNIISTIEKRFISDVPVQLALSGGVDSTLVALVANEREKYFHRVLTVNSSSRPSEAIKSNSLCEELQMPQGVIDFDGIDFLELMKKAISAQGGPLSHPNALGVFALAQEAKRQGKVLITGEGADELMYGYDHYERNDLTFAFQEHNDPSFYFNVDSSDQVEQSQNIQLERFLQNNDYRDLDVKTHLLSLLRRNDRMSMHNSIELRSAYLDSELFKIVSKWQENGLLLKGKSTLVEIIKDVYSRYEVDSSKIGFYVPFDDWYYLEGRNSEIVKGYITEALNFLRTKLNWCLKEGVSIRGKFAWGLLNIGIFLALEGEIYE